MNIHINKQIYRNLYYSTFENFLVGSHLYEINNKRSDKDYLMIYANGKRNMNSFTWQHHQFQYKDETNKIDYIFTDLKNFIRNLINGDSSINFEILFNERFQKSSLSFISDYRFDFINYNLLKLYLGLAKRDLTFVVKNYRSRGPNNKQIDSNRKLAHAFRSVYAVENLLKNQYCNNFKSDFLLNVKNNKEFLPFEKPQIIDCLRTKTDNLRKKINIMLEKKVIYRFMNPIKMKELDEKLLEFTSSELFENHQKEFIDYNLLEYSAIENGIKYD